jgi:hypothetical protein
MFKHGELFFIKLVQLYLRCITKTFVLNTGTSTNELLFDVAAQHVILSK